MSANIDEFARQRALDAYRVVDTVPEQAFDDITRLASMICDAPIALCRLSTATDSGSSPGSAWTCPSPLPT